MSVVFFGQNKLTNTLFIIAIHPEEQGKRATLGSRSVKALSIDNNNDTTLTTSKGENI